MRPLARGGAPLFRRSEHGTCKRDSRPGECDRRGPLAGGDRDRERHDRAAGDDRRDDAHRANGERAVERRQAGAAAGSGGQADCERAAVEVGSAGGEDDQQRGEPGCLGHDCDSDGGEPP